MFVLLLFTDVGEDVDMAIHRLVINLLPTHPRHVSSIQSFPQLNGILLEPGALVLFHLHGRLIHQHGHRVH